MRVLSDGQDEQMRVLCVGMASCDILMSPVPEDILHRDSATLDRLAISCGGDALNVALGLAKLGQKVSLAGRIADDINGRFIQEECLRFGVETSGLIKDEEHPTATSFALIDTRYERHFLSIKSIYEAITPSDVSDELLAEASIVYFGSAMGIRGMGGPEIAELFKRAKQMGKLTVMDAAIDENRLDVDWMHELAPAFEQTDIFFPSLDEAALIAHTDNLQDAASQFQTFGMKALGIKLGAKGSYLTDFVRDQFIPAYDQTSVVDTTGAGDSFMAGLITGVLKGWDLFTSTHFASLIAGHNVGAIGGTAGIPSFEEAHKAFQNWYQIKE